MMERTSQLCKEIWRLDEKIWKHLGEEEDMVRKGPIVKDFQG